MSKSKGDRIVQIILLAIIIVGIGLIITTLRGGNGGPGGMPSGGFPGGFGGRTLTQSTNTVAVEAETLVRGNISQFIKVNGDVVSDTSVAINSDVGGEIVNYNVKVGDYVNKDDVIAVVNPSTPGVVYSNRNVISTISGTVTSVSASVGDRVNTNSAIAVIGDLQNLSIVTYIPERYITNLKMGLNAEVTMESFPGRVFNARVIQLNPVLDSQSRSMEIKLDILDSDPSIKSGMFTSMKLITKESLNVINIPTTAISDYYNSKIVYVVKDDNTVEKREVIIGLSSEDRIEIVDGLTDGEKVVTLGINSITDGTSVNIINSEGGN